MDILSVRFYKKFIDINGKKFSGHWENDQKRKLYIFVTTHELPNVIYRLLKPSIVFDPDNGRPASYGFEVPWYHPYGKKVTDLLKETTNELYSRT